MLFRSRIEKGVDNKREEGGKGRGRSESESLREEKGHEKRGKRRYKGQEESLKEIFFH